MSRQFTLPVAIALSFHAFLFLGFTKDPSLNLRPKKTDTEPRPLEVNFPPPEEEVVLSSEPASSGPKPIASVPTLPEPNPTIVPIGMIAAQIPPSVPNSLPTAISSIPVGNPRGNTIGDGDGNGPNIFKIGALDNPPRTRFQVSPPYPAALKAAGVKGEVWVEFVVNEEGRVTNAHVIRSSHADFEETTLRAVRQWRFEPGKRNGRAVRFRMSVPIVFNLTDGN